MKAVVFFNLGVMRVTKFSDWLRARRAEAGLAVKEAAERLGLGKSMISLLERGDNIPSAASFERIKAAYGEPPKELNDWLTARIGKRALRTELSGQENPQAAWLKTARIERRISQRDLAKRMEVNRSCVMAAETGRYVLCQANRLKAESVLGSMPEEARKWFARQDAIAAESRSKLSDEERSPLGRLVRARRLELGLAQEAVAGRMGRTSENFMQNVENGSLRLKDKVLADLAAALELPAVPAEWIEARKASGQDGWCRNELPAEEIPSLGAELRRIRKAAGLTCKAAAFQSGLSRSFYGKVECGLCAAGDEVLQKIARGLGLPAVPGRWITLREASGQSLQHTHGGLNDSLSPLGVKLRLLRMRRKVIQSELDQRCGLFKGYIGRLEYGRDTVTPERLEVILTCLGVAGLPEEWKAAVEEGHQWREAPGIRASDLSTEGAQARRARLEAGRSMIEQAQHEGVSLKVVRERELGKFETWRKRVKKT